jgi:hypothetical protein
MTKMGWATFGGDFVTNSSDHPVCKRNAQMLKGFAIEFFTSNYLHLSMMKTKIKAT